MTPPKCWFCSAAVFLWEWSSDVVLCCRFEELYNIRVAYQAFEQFDMKGLLIDQDILLSSIKVGIPEYLATWLSTYTWMDPIKVILESNKCNIWTESLSGSIIQYMSRYIARNYIENRTLISLLLNNHWPPNYNESKY